MRTIDSNEVYSSGGQHSIKLGVTFEDPETQDYEHAIVWGFEPTLATDSQTPILEVRTVLHKKYWKEITPELTKHTTDDGSEIVYSGGWMTGPFETTQIPASVKNKFQSIFGDTLTTNTIEQPDEIFDVDFHSPTLPSIPSEHTVILPDFTVRIDGDYTEYLEESDERVAENDFTSHMKDAKNGEVLQTSHPLNHSISWWFEPREGEEGLQIEQCFHKTWDDKTKRNFDEEYDNENIVEEYQSSSESPPISSLPDDVLKELSDWFGEPLVKEMLSQTERTMPTYAYECLDCNSISEVTPRNTCPKCGSNSTCRYNSLQDYYKYMAGENETMQDIKEEFSDMNITVE